MTITGENKYTEYKREYTKTFLKTVSAFANFHNGSIVFGMDDVRNIVGIDDAENLRLAIEHSISDSIEPTPYYEIELQLFDQKHILVLKVFKGEHTPYYCNGKAYKRNDTSTVQVDRIALTELILTGRNLCFDELETDYEDLSFNFMLSRLKKAIGITQISDDLLKTLMLRKHNRYTNAAVLFSDFNPLNASNVNLIAYEDHTVNEIVDRDLLEGMSVIEQYERCMLFYKKHINIGEKIEGPYRETIEEIPLVAYREAIANALVHRDYSRDSAIRVEIFNDRVEVVSPGSLPVGLSVDEYENGNVSLVRNRIVADVFRKLNLIEKFGTGVRRIKEQYRRYTLKPVFSVFENSILVILPKVNAKANEQAHDSKVKYISDDRESMVYKMLLSNGTLRRSDIEKALNLGRSQTGDILKSMGEKRLIIKLGNGRNTKYCIKA